MFRCKRIFSDSHIPTGSAAGGFIKRPDFLKMPLSCPPAVEILMADINNQFSEAGRQQSQSK
jgi:hypothetical protein